MLPERVRRPSDMAKILIVDDEEHIRYLYSEELSEAGFKEALAVLNEELGG